LHFVPIERDAAQGVVIFLEDMQRAQAEAQQIKLAALGRLTANMAHEVRNPLSAISYATELLQEELGDAGQARLLQLIQDNTHRLNRIVQDVMQLNRRDRSHPEILDLSVWLPVFIEEFSQAERLQPGILVLNSLPACRIAFDQGHLHQILWNLCSNAWHYCQRQPASLALVIHTENAPLTLEVQDDGPGISTEHQLQLFEPFFTTSKQGTGLGLYIARELCEANGARLEYYPDETRNGGSSFRITFIENAAPST
jgi:two-component system sensor histidine kinase PilS (NtrC family)